jgi:aspartate dehydrogenase
MRVGVIGNGAIGSIIVEALQSGRVPDGELIGVVRRNPTSPGEFSEIADLLNMGCDLIVEAAGREAVINYGAQVMDRGADLLVMSAGALSHRDVERRLRKAGPGRLIISTGAVGGIDILRAHALAGTLQTVEITSTAVQSAVAGVVGEAMRATIAAAEGAVTVASGTARQLAQDFPRSTNVAAMLALATLGLDHVTATLKVDPKGTVKRHDIVGITDAGRLTISIENTVSLRNSRTSAVTGYAALRYLLDRESHVVIGT